MGEGERAERSVESALWRKVGVSRDVWQYGQQAGKVTSRAQGQSTTVIPLEYLFIIQAPKGS